MYLVYWFTLRIFNKINTVFLISMLCNFVYQCIYKKWQFFFIWCVGVIAEIACPILIQNINHLNSKFWLAYSTKKYVYYIGFPDNSGPPFFAWHSSVGFFPIFWPYSMNALMAFFCKPPLAETDFASQWYSTNIDSSIHFNVLIESSYIY